MNYLFPRFVMLLYQIIKNIFILSIKLTKTNIKFKNNLAFPSTLIQNHSKKKKKKQNQFPKN